MAEGIKMNNLELINNALSKGVTLNDGLTEAIEQKNFDYVKYFIEKGANPSSGIKKAVRVNNIIFVKYLLENGAKFNDEETYVFVGQTYYNKSPISSPISPKIINGRNCFVYDEDSTLIHPGGTFTYQTEAIFAGNQSLILAIDNNNPEMVEIILKNGVNVQKPCVVFFFEGMPSNLQITGNTVFSPAIIMLPINYAIFKKADKNIMDILYKYDAKP